jgi:hypothetical protein
VSAAARLEQQRMLQAPPAEFESNLAEQKEAAARQLMR